MRFTLSLLLTLPLAYYSRVHTCRAHMELEPTKEVIGLYPDFERSAALVLAFAGLIQHHPKALVDIVTALDDRIPIVGVVADESQDLEVRARLKEAQAPTKNLDIVQVPVVGIWMRDYGPAFIRLPNGRFMALDALYVRKNYEPDDLMPRYLAGYFRLPLVDVPLRVSGGNFLTNGEGWIFTTSQMVEFNVKDGYTQSEIGEMLGRYYGATDWIVLKPLTGEPTQHVDMFLTLVASDVAVLGAYDPEEDPENSRLLEEAASLLSRVRTRSGPLRVIRIPMPSHRDGKWRTYTNVIFANETLLIPAYPDLSPELDQKALEIYSELLPDRRIVQIDASDIIQKNGSLHCISINVPGRRD